MRPRGGTEIEVVLLWGTTSPCVLRVAYVACGAVFALGTSADCDVCLPEGTLDAARTEVVAFRARPRVLPPPGAHVCVGGREAPAIPTLLTHSATIEVRFGAFTLQARLVEHERLPRARRSARSLLPTGASALAHLACLTTLANLSSPVAATGEIAPEQLAVMRRLLSASESTPLPPAPSVVRATVSEAARHGHVSDPVSRPLSAARTSGDPPAATLRASSATAARTTGDVRASRAAEIDEAKGFGMIDLARGLRADGPEAPSWGEALASAGTHAAEVQSLFGDPPMEEWGIGGLCVSGVGVGGGGKAGDGKEVGTEIAVLSDMLERERATFVPGAIVKVPDHHARLGPPAPLDQVPSLPLPGDTIARQVQANGWRIHDCHAVLQRVDPSAGGTVNVAFTIEPSGKVSEAHETGGDVTDVATRACVARAFFALTFPAEPRRGHQQVTYRVVLAPRR